MTIDVGLISLDGMPNESNFEANLSESKTTRRGKTQKVSIYNDK